jgi:hypothetical protein
MTYTS